MGNSESTDAASPRKSDAEDDDAQASILSDYGRACCSSSPAMRRAGSVAQGICCADGNTDCVLRDSAEHRRMKIRQSLEHQLLLSATKGNVDEIRLIMSQDVDLNAKSKDGKTPLHLAVHSGATEAAALLVHMGANPNVTDKEKRTPLHIACLNNHREIARCLVEEGGADSDRKDQGMKVPMHLACINGHSKMVDLLVQCKAGVETEAKEILQPIHLAVLGNHCYITTLLLNARARVDNISGK